MTIPTSNVFWLYGWIKLLLLLLIAKFNYNFVFSLFYGVEYTVENHKIVTKYGNFKIEQNSVP